MAFAGGRKGVDGWFVLICLAILCLSMVGVCEFSMDVQGSIFCLSSDNKATPISGATAKIICKEEGSNGGERSMVSSPTNSKGFYSATATSKSMLGNCRAFLESSPLRDCSSPTDVNGGRRGAPLIPFSSSSSDDDTQHYSVKTFFYSPN